MNNELAKSGIVDDIERVIASRTSITSASLVATPTIDKKQQEISFLCRHGIHSNMCVDPTDDEHAELCALLCRHRSSLTINGMSSMLDRVCVRCGAIDARLQRFIASLKKLRKLAD